MNHKRVQEREKTLSLKPQQAGNDAQALLALGRGSGLMS